MDIQEYFNKMKNVEWKLLEFLDHEDNEEENYENFLKIINDENIRTNQYDFKIILYLINEISINHYRLRNFFNKIEQILKEITKEIKQFYSNDEIYKIFNASKRILLFLIEEKVVIIDQNIYKEMMTKKYKKMQYPEYFSFEIQTFIGEGEGEEKEKEKNYKKLSSSPLSLNEEESDEEYLSSTSDEEEDSSLSNLYETIQKNLKENFDEFNEKRKKGENDDYLCEIIQIDNIDEFITYVNKNDYPLNSNVEKSIFETNEFLLKQKETKLIEYAAFYGSSQIFKYLIGKGVKMTPKIWLYAIHGNDEEIKNILEENKIKIEDKGVNSLYEQCIKESIKCHHNLFANYIMNNYAKYGECNDDIFSLCLKYYNFTFYNLKTINYNLFLYVCKYDYFRIVEFLLNRKDNDLIKLKIYIIF